MSKEIVLVRYRAGQRVNHWVGAIALVLLALSGMAFFHPSLFFLTDLFGGGQMTRMVHPWIGVVMAVSFLAMLVRFARDNLWNRDDSVWMGKLGAVISGDEEKLPELGKYNAGQKLVFWFMALGILLLLGTGLIMWDTYFFDVTTIDQKRWALLLHAIGAVGIILLLIVHVYAAIWVKGSIRAMTDGTVTGGWAWRHHRKWLRAEVAKGVK
jgi:formate dehydrogenase subunit gamma